MADPLKSELASLQVRVGADSSGAYLEARQGMKAPWHTVKRAGFKERSLHVQAADLVAYLQEKDAGEAPADGDERLGIAPDNEAPVDGEAPADGAEESTNE